MCGLLRLAPITYQGPYQSRVMPFGLTNAPNVFQRLLQKVLDQIVMHEGTNLVEIHIDDVLMFSCTMKEHVEHIRTPGVSTTKEGRTEAEAYKVPLYLPSSRVFESCDYTRRTQAKSKASIFYPGPRVRHFLGNT